MRRQLVKDEQATSSLREPTYFIGCASENVQVPSIICFRGRIGTRFSASL